MLPGHANTSVMLALEHPDKYTRERMGHGTSSTLKKVCQRTIRTKQDAVDSYFSQKLHTVLPTKLTRA